MVTLSSTSGYTSIKIPNALATKIKNVAEKDGYRSISEFVTEATRIRLDKYES